MLSVYIIYKAPNKYVEGVNKASGFQKKKKLIVSTISKQWS